MNDNDPKEDSNASWHLLNSPKAHAIDLPPRENNNNNKPTIFINAFLQKKTIRTEETQTKDPDVIEAPNLKKMAIEEEKLEEKRKIELPPQEEKVVSLEKKMEIDTETPKENAYSNESHFQVLEPHQPLAFPEENSEKCSIKEMNTPQPLSNEIKIVTSNVDDSTNKLEENAAITNQNILIHTFQGESQQTGGNIAENVNQNPQGEGQPTKREEEGSKPLIIASVSPQNIQESGTTKTATILPFTPIPIPEPQPQAKKISFASAKKEIDDFTAQIEKYEQEIKDKYGISISDYYYEDLLPDELKIKLVEEFFSSKEIVELANKK